MKGNYAKSRRSLAEREREGGGRVEEARENDKEGKRKRAKLRIAPRAAWAFLVLY